MKTILFITLFLLLFSLFFSCEKDSGPYVAVLGNPIDTTKIDTNGTGQPTIPDPTIYSYSISYGTHVKPVFQQNCIQACHNPQHPKLDLRPSVSYAQLLTDGFSAPYVNTINPEQSSLYLHLAGVYTLMPQGGPKLSQGQIDTVYTWIAQGALNN
jgi:hypothetical protein